MLSDTDSVGEDVEDMRSVPFVHETRVYYR